MAKVDEAAIRAWLRHWEASTLPTNPEGYGPVLSEAMSHIAFLLDQLDAARGGEQELLAETTRQQVDLDNTRVALDTARTELQERREIALNKAADAATRDTLASVERLAREHVAHGQLEPFLWSLEQLATHSRDTETEGTDGNGKDATDNART